MTSAKTPTRSFAVQGTIFWLVVSAIAGPILAFFPDSPFFEFPLVLVPVATSAIYVVIAYFVWKLRPWGFLAAAAMALIILATTVAVSQLRFPGDELLAVVQMLTILFSLRGYAEVRAQ
jgi:hypothetical protein